MIQIAVKIFIATIIGVFFILAVINIIKYRFSISKYIIIKNEIVFQMIDLGQNDFFRTNVFEYILNKKRIFTINSKNEVEYFFLNKNDYDLCWRESPFELLNQNKTLLLTIKTKRLLFDGLYPAKIIKIDKINKPPIIRK